MSAMKRKRTLTTPRPKAFELTVYGRRLEDGSIWWFPSKPSEPEPNLVESPNFVFHDCLRLERLFPSYAVWRSLNNRQLWYTTPARTLQMLRHPECSQGTLCAHFIFEKHSRGYGLRLATEAERWWWERYGTRMVSTTAT